MKSKHRQYYRVEVMSQRRPGLKAVNEVDANEKRLVPLAAAACAEHLNETYKDDLDPDAAAIEMEKLLAGLVEGTIIEEDEPLGEIW